MIANSILCLSVNYRKKLNMLQRSAEIGLRSMTLSHIIQGFKDHLLSFCKTGLHNEMQLSFHAIKKTRQNKISCVFLWRFLFLFASGACRDHHLFIFFLLSHFCFLLLHPAVCLHRVCVRPVRGGLPAAVWVWEQRPVWQTERRVQLQGRLGRRALWERWVCCTTRAKHCGEVSSRLDIWRTLSLVIFLSFTESSQGIVSEPSLLTTSINYF